MYLCFLTSHLLTFQTEPQTHLTETQTGAASMPSVTSSTMIWRGKSEDIVLRILIMVWLVLIEVF